MVDDWCSCLRGAASDLQRARVWTNDGCVGLPTTSREQFSRERSAASTEDTMSATCLAFSAKSKNLSASEAKSSFSKGLESMKMTGDEMVLAIPHNFFGESEKVNDLRFSMA